MATRLQRAMRPEIGTPAKLGKEHTGSRVLYRLAHSCSLREGEVSEFSETGKFVRVGKAWMPNRAGSIVAILPVARNAKSRRDEI